MFIAVFIALVILVAAVLLTRHYYLCKIDTLKAALIARDERANLDFRRGYDGGWSAAIRYRDQKAERDAIMIVK